MTKIPVLLVLAASALLLRGTAGAGYQPNSIGPAWLAEDLFGINYERSVSPLLAVDALAATNGEIDFGGLRLMISKPDPAFQVRPSLGMCIIRGEYDDGVSEDEESPWFGFVWPGLGICLRAAGHFSADLDLSAIYGNTGEDEEEVYGVLSASLMYMF